MEGTYFTPSVMDRIIELSFHLLENTGISLNDTDALAELANMGYKINDSRVLVEKKKAKTYLESHIKAKQPKTKSGPISISCWVNNYSHSYIPPYEYGEERFTTKTLIQSSGAIQALGSLYGKKLGICGYASDVPVVMQDVNRYWLESKYFGGHNPEPMDSRTYPYLMEMASINGCKTLYVPIYMISPLKMGDEGYKIVRAYGNKINVVSVSSMPSFGISTPFAISEAFAITLAEVLGGAIIVEDLTNIPAHIYVNVESFDFRYMTQAFGTPEKMMLETLTRDFQRALYGSWDDVIQVEIHTQATCPGLQSAAEKSLTMMNGYHLAKNANKDCCFRGAGTLAMDEVFSPTQLVMDLEIQKGISHMENWYGFDKDAVDMNELLEGINESFIATERTSELARRYYNDSKVFHRYSLTGWKNAGKPDSLRHAEDIAQKAWENDPIKVIDHETEKAIDEVYQSALRYFTS